MSYSYLIEKLDISKNNFNHFEELVNRREIPLKIRKRVIATRGPKAIGQGRRRKGPGFRLFLQSSLSDSLGRSGS
jgi:hypothetical protein